MRRAGALSVSVALVMAAACSPPSQAPISVGNPPKRIVSLDYCSDQFVLKLADRDQILALSRDASKDFSYLAKEATGLATVRAQAEDVMVLRPDLVARSYGGGPGAEAYFARAGLPLAQLSYAEDYKGIIANVRTMATAFGHPERGEALVEEFEARLAAIKTAGPHPPTALYLTPSGITSGQGSLVHVMMESAGLSNFQDQAGWNPIPLERLARERPQLVIAASFGAKSSQIADWSAARHPVARAVMRDQPTIPISGALTSCGGWFVIDAIEAMATTGASVQHQGLKP
jgi:iron complex transport system substrate-binding protein